MADISTQIALLTDSIKAMRSGCWTGPGSVDAIYCALKGGLPAPDYEPVWPTGLQHSPASVFVANGPYLEDPAFEADVERYGVRIAELLGPAIGLFARAQARLETGNGRLFSTPFNFGNIGNTDTNPKGGGGFASPEEAADAWVAFVTNSGGPTRYQAFLDAGRGGADVATLAGLIAAAGYATDPNYAAKVAAFA